MRYLSFLFFLVFIAYLAWPYYSIYRLDNALKQNDRTTLTELVDLASIRDIYKETVKRNLSHLQRFGHTMGVEANPFLDTINQGIVGIGQSAVDKTVDLEWVKKCLVAKAPDQSSFWQAVSFAFYESPTRFTLRVGELGHAPVYAQMTLQDWSWRLVGVYDCLY